jgi:hypothetical protein
MHQQFKHTPPPPPSCHFRVHPRAPDFLCFYDSAHSVFVIEYYPAWQIRFARPHTRWKVNWKRCFGWRGFIFIFWLMVSLVEWDTLMCGGQWRDWAICIRLACVQGDRFIGEFILEFNVLAVTLSLFHSARECLFAFNGISWQPWFFNQNVLTSETQRATDCDF